MTRPGGEPPTRRETPLVSVDGVGEGQLPGQQSQRGGEVVDVHFRDHRVERVAEQWQPELIEVGADLVGPAGSGTDLVAGPRAAHLDHVDPRLRVRRQVQGLGLQHPHAFDQVRPHHLREPDVRVEGGDGLVDLARLAAREHVLIGRAPPLPRGHQQHPGGAAIQPVRRRQLRQPRGRPAFHDGALQHVPAARNGRQEVRFVEHDDPFVAVQHLQRARHLGLRP